MDKACLLRDRGIVALEGAEAAKFLQRLVTNSVYDIPAGESRYAALLTAQGKLMFDFFIVPLPEGPDAGFFIDCVKDQAEAIARQLNFLKMRAKIAIADRSSDYVVAAIWDGAAPAGVATVVYKDPRAPNMGLRMIAPAAAVAAFDDSGEAAYEAHRVAEGVPKGGIDFLYGDAFVQEANIDWMNGVDYKKGCFIGQEVVARVYHRKSARKRIVKVHFKGPTPMPGAAVAAG
jgi:folate-binding protein YgfZ